MATNRLICSSGGISWRLLSLMASGTSRSSVAVALNSLIEDGITFPGADNNNVEALISDYFNDSDDSASGSDSDEECSKYLNYVSENIYMTLNIQTLQ